MSPDLYLAYVIACLFIALLPGPTITLIIATSIRHGTRAGLGNVAGTQVGLAVMIAVVGVGLASLIEGMGHWFEWLRLLGAAYLIWMGIQMFRSAGAADETGVPPPPRGGFFLQGVLVAASNPKTWCSSAPSSRSSSIRPATMRCRSSSWASPPWPSPQ